MRTIARWSLVVLGSVGVATSCGGHSAPASGDPKPRTSRPRTPSDMILPEEIQRAQYSTAYDLVNALRPQWLRPRGPDTMNGRPAEVQAVLDGMKLGGVSALRNLPTSGIAFVQFFDGPAASTRWGLGFGNGAIYISTRSR